MWFNGTTLSCCLFGILLLVKPAKADNEGVGDANASEGLIAWSTTSSNLEVRVSIDMEHREPQFSDGRESMDRWLDTIIPGTGTPANRIVRIRAHSETELMAWGQGLRVEFLTLKRQSWTGAGDETATHHGKDVNTAYNIFIKTPSRGETAVFHQSKKLSHGAIWDQPDWSSEYSNYGWCPEVALGLGRIDNQSLQTTDFWRRMVLAPADEHRVLAEVIDPEKQLRHVWTFAIDSPFRLLQYQMYLTTQTGREYLSFEMNAREFFETGGVGLPITAEAKLFAWNHILEESAEWGAISLEYTDYKPLPVREDEEAVWYEWPKGAEVRDARVGETIKVMRDGEKLTDAVIAQYLAEQIGPREKAVDELLESLEPAAN